MSVPGDVDLPFCPGLNDVSGPPTNNTSPIGGAIQTGTILNDSATGTVLAGLSVQSSDMTYYGITYRVNLSGSAPTSDAQYLANPRIGNRNGGQVNTTSGVAVIVSTSPADVGNLSIVGKSGAAWEQLSTLLNGTTPVSSSTNWDANSYAYAEYLDPGTGLPTVPNGNISMTIAGQLVLVIYGGSSGYTHSCALYQNALATSKNTAVSSTNRVAAPASGISAFSYNTIFPNADNSITVPGGNFLNNDYIAIIVLLLLPGGMPVPIGGELDCDIALLGDPQTP